MLLAFSAILLMVVNEMHVIEMTVFASTLLVQSLPFLAAAAMVAIERYQGRDATSKQPAVGGAGDGRRQRPKRPSATREAGS